jgi:hypothetical protein
MAAGRPRWASSATALLAPGTRQLPVRSPKSTAAKSWLCNVSGERRERVDPARQAPELMRGSTISWPPARPRAEEPVEPHIVDDGKALLASTLRCRTSEASGATLRSR